MNKKIISIVIILFMLMCFTGCETIFGNSADTVKQNISKDADEFKVKRRITFVNLRDGQYLFQMTGNCSVKGGASSSNGELEVICRIGDDKYQKHMLYIADETTYVVEQLEYSDVSRYDYEIVFRPEAIAPITIKTQIGNE